MKAAIASVIPSSFRFSSPTNSPSIPTVFNLKGHLNLKCQSIPTGIEWKRRRTVKASQSASASSNRSGSASASPIAPLRLESPMGQFLYEVLKIHPGLVHDVAKWQLQQIQRALDAEEHKEDSSASFLEPLLYRRIAEVKANERKKAVEEILYVLVVLKFMDANVSLIPRVSPPLDSWPSLSSMDPDPEKLHSPEAYKMIKNHLALILGSLFDDSTKTKVTKMSRLMIRRMYACYVVYGYFVKGLDVRFQLEKTMNILPYASDGGDNKANNYYDGSVRSVNSQHQPEVSCLDLGSSGGRKKREKLSPLGSYVKSIDPEILMKFTAIRSEEGVSIAQKHIKALVGDEEEDEVVKISLGGVKRLILEAVTFGYLLWDVESFVDCRLPFVSN